MKIAALLLSWVLLAQAQEPIPIFWNKKSGIVRQNLVGAWNLGSVNLLRWSEDFSNAAWSSFAGASATSNSITFTSTSNSQMYQLFDLINTVTYTFSVQASSASSVKFRLGAYYDSALHYSSDFTTTTTPTTYSFTFTASGNTVGESVYITSDSSSTAGTITASRAQLNEGATALPYQATTDNQRVPVGTSGSMPIRREIGGAVAYDPAPDAASRYTYANGETRAVVGTNLALQSEDLTSATWSKGEVTIAADATTAPNGSSSADKMVEAATTARHGVLQGVAVTSGASYVVSAYAKQAERTWFVISTYDTGSDKVSYFDLANGVTGTVATGHTASIVSMGNGWYRCSVSVTARATTLYPILVVTTGNGVYSHAGDIAKGIYIWGAQLNPGTLPDAYTKTEAVALEPGYYWITNGTTATADTNDGVRRYLGLVMDGVDDRLLSLPTKGSAWTVINCSSAHCYGVDSASGSFVDGIKTAGASEFALTTAGGYTGTATYLLYYSRVLTPKEHAQNYFQVIKPTVNARGGTLP